MSRDGAKDRAEGIWLSAESLERHLIASNSDQAVLSVVNEVVISARELYSALDAVVVAEGEPQ